MKVIVPLAKSVLTALTTVTSASAINGVIQWKMHESGFVRTGKGITSVDWNEDKDDIIRIIKSLESSRILIDGVSETVKHKIRRQKGRLLSMLLGNLGASVLGHMLTW